jgi:hypothetical protein
MFSQLTVSRPQTVRQFNQLNVARAHVHALTCQIALTRTQLADTKALLTAQGIGLAILLCLVPGALAFSIVKSTAIHLTGTSVGFLALLGILMAVQSITRVYAVRDSLKEVVQTIITSMFCLGAIIGMMC